MTSQITPKERQGILESLHNAETPGGTSNPEKNHKERISVALEEPPKRRGLNLSPVMCDIMEPLPMLRAINFKCFIMQL